ncbi:MAG TPA: pantoate--beta-alanine ligase [Chloroflexota bacterium]|nr:pantoate--beta-alanine ligase [Chloroflexota bacterium]HZU05547.1 pantoate--beta-alanine ligase [Chloroflexota bacterium]
MEEVVSIAALRAALATRPAPVGFVPTMGYLHEGHLSLARRARAENATVVLSVFVNPTQFGPHEDYAQYPRDLARDRALAAEVGVDVLFVPTVEEMYPPGAATWVEVEGVSRRWEGERRPGHFRGVATIVLKLFLAVRPTRAYFGEKDYQQLLVVRRLVADLPLDLEIIGCPTVREPDGLALSSRNTYLDPPARAQAVALSRALARAQALLSAGERRGPALEAAMQAELAAYPQVRLDYAAVVDAATLEPLPYVDREARALIAAYVGSVRLIDNAPLLPPAT